MAKTSNLRGPAAAIILAFMACALSGCSDLAWRKIIGANGYHGGESTKASIFMRRHEYRPGRADAAPEDYYEGYREPPLGYRPCTVCGVWSYDNIHKVKRR